MPVRKPPPIKVDERLTTFNPESIGKFNQIMNRIIVGLMMATILLFGVIAILRIWVS